MFENLMHKTRTDSSFLLSLILLDQMNVLAKIVVNHVVHQELVFAMGMVSALVQLRTHVLYKDVRG